MFARILASLAAVAVAALTGCASTNPVPAPQPVNHPNESGAITGGVLFNGN